MESCMDLSMKNSCDWVTSASYFSRLNDIRSSEGIIRLHDIEITTPLSSRHSDTEEATLTWLCETVLHKPEYIPCIYNWLDNTVRNHP